ncbi:hypothetical protein DL93DRAFT_2083351 [Clavulina sp. PMI_390]|nr:hypothetical protein DL93DRAFT_2083351 [Clavulina sp. PMI_390]
MLATPLVFASAGLIPGLFSLFFCGAVAYYGLYLLSACAAEAPPGKASFFAVAQLTTPSLAVFFDAAIAIKCFGVSVSYLIIIKGLMPSVVQALHTISGSETPLPWILVSGRFWLAAFMLILIPLCFLRRMDSLRHMSYVALFTVVYLVIIVVVCYFDPPKGSAPPGEWHYFNMTPNFISTFPTLIFGFTCSQNLFPIYNELASNTQKRMNLVMQVSVASAGVAYLLVAMFGYLSFGDNVGANIIAMYPESSLFIALGQFAVVILVLFSHPMQVHPCRTCLDKVFDPKDPKAASENSAAEMSALKHTLLTWGIIILGFTIAYYVDDLQIVLSFVGSTGSVTISFILPGLFYYKLFGQRPETSRLQKWGSAGLFIYGVLVFIFCLSYNIWKVSTQ